MIEYHFKTTEGPNIGPIAADDFQKRIAAGEIANDTMVWRSGMIEWFTFAQLRAADENAAKPPVAEPPPLLAVVDAAEAPDPAIRPAFRNCSLCEQQWPENLLRQFGLKHVCGICQRTKQEELKKSKLRTHASGVSSGWGSWFIQTAAIAFALGTLLFGKAWMKNQFRQGSKTLQQEVQSVALKLEK